MSGAPTASCYASAFILSLTAVSTLAFFEKCTNCPPVQAATGTYGSANCQTGKQCSPNALVEVSACTVGCNAPDFSQLVFKSGLSWLTAANVTCTSGIYYANGRTISPKLLNCQLAPGVTTTTTVATTTTTIAPRDQSFNCAVPGTMKCDISADRCNSDVPLEFDESTREIHCPHTSSLYLSRTESVGKRYRYAWAGAIRCMKSGFWRTMADPTPREYRGEHVKMFCAPPPKTDGLVCGRNPSEMPLLSPCPGVACTAITNSIFVQWENCRSYECPNSDMRIAVQGASGTFTQLAATISGFVPTNGPVSGPPFSWGTPVACVLTTPISGKLACSMPTTVKCELSDLPTERCTTDTPLAYDSDTGEIHCPPTSSLFIARMGVHTWAGAIRCMESGLWRTTGEPTPHEYRADDFQMFCALQPPYPGTWPGCDRPPSPPLLSTCPATSCSSIANSVSVSWAGCKNLECPNGDQRIAVEGISGYATHITIQSGSSYSVMFWSTNLLGTVPNTNAAACMTGCIFPVAMPCHLSSEQCISDVPAPYDKATGQIKCPSTSSLYIARTESIGNPSLSAWVGGIRCMDNGRWRTTEDPTPREYRHDSIKIFCGKRAPSSGTWPGCDRTPSPPLLSTCPGSSCTSIADSTFVTWAGCKGLECPNGDQRIAVEGLSELATHISIQTPDTYLVHNGNTQLKTFPNTNPVGCVNGWKEVTTTTTTTTMATTTTTQAPTTTTTTPPAGPPPAHCVDPKCPLASPSQRGPCRRAPCGDLITKTEANGCLYLVCTEGFVMEILPISYDTPREYKKVPLPMVCYWGSWQDPNGGRYQGGLLLSCSTP